MVQGIGFLPPNLGMAIDDEYIYGFYKSGSIFTWSAKKKSDNNTASGIPNSNENTFVDKIFSTTTANNKSYTAAWSTLVSYPNSIVRIGFNHTKRSSI